MNPLNLPIAEVVRRYRGGESTVALGRACDTSPANVRYRLLAEGVKMRGCGGVRSRGGPLFDNGEGHLGTVARDGRNCLVHRGCWEAHNGPIPAGYVIHHKNADRRDNRIENLACMTPGEHNHAHTKRLPIAAMVARYRAGESTYAIAAAHGVHQTTVWSRLISAGVGMRHAKTKEAESERS